LAASFVGTAGNRRRLSKNRARTERRVGDLLRQFDFHLRLFQRYFLNRRPPPVRVQFRHSLTLRNIRDQPGGRPRAFRWCLAPRHRARFRAPFREIRCPCRRLQRASPVRAMPLEFEAGNATTTLQVRPVRNLCVAGTGFPNLFSLVFTIKHRRVNAGTNNRIRILRGGRPAG
jgi:hypothetical protein